MVFKNFLEKEVVLIEKEIDSILAAELKKICETHSDLEELFRYFFNAVKGGKRIRGSLVVLGYDLAGGGESQEIYKIASAFEIFQTAILVHDDIIDQSELRRGKASLYRQIGSGHYGVSQALCLADYGFFLSSQIIIQSRFEESLKLQALQNFNKVVLDTMFGEILDLKLPFSKKDISDEDGLIISYLKTAQYSFIGPLQIGAILAGADTTFLEILEAFGKDLGMAFQIKDDVLGSFGSEKAIGKPKSSDILEGKATLLISYANQHSNESQKKILKKYGNGHITEKELESVKQVLSDVGAVGYAEGKALEYIKSAKLIIPKITDESKKQQILQELADFLIERAN